MSSSIVIIGLIVSNVIVCDFSNDVLFALSFKYTYIFLGPSPVDIVTVPLLLVTPFICSHLLQSLFSLTHIWATSLFVHVTLYVTFVV